MNFMASGGPAMEAKISISLDTPSALIRSTSGIGVVPALGILTISIPSLLFSTFRGFLTPSFWENIFAT